MTASLLEKETLKQIADTERRLHQLKHRVGAVQPEAIIERLSEVETEQVSWLWTSRIPRGKLTLLEGDPGLGKSTMALDLAARLSRGRPMPDGTPGPATAGVVLLTAEDGLADTVAPRLDAAGADRARVIAFTGVRLGDVDRPPVFPDDLCRLAAVIDDIKAGLVILDPLVAFLGGGVDSWRDQDVRRALHPLVQLAEATGVAVLALRHLTKGGGPQAIYRGGGSIGIVGAARSALLVARDPDAGKRRVLAMVKCNLAKEPPSLTFQLESTARDVARVVWGGESPHRANALVAPPATEEERSTFDMATDLLREELRAAPQKTRDVQRQARRTGIGERTLNKARKSLGVRPQKIGGEWWLSLPPEGGACTLAPLAEMASKTDVAGREQGCTEGEASQPAPLPGNLGEAVEALRGKGDGTEPEPA